MYIEETNIVCVCVWFSGSGVSVITIFMISWYWHLVVILKWS